MGTQTIRFLLTCPRDAPLLHPEASSERFSSAKQKRQEPVFHDSFTQNHSSSRPRMRWTRLIRCSELALVGSCCTVNHTARAARLTRPPWGEVDTKESTPTCVCIPGGRTPKRKVRRWKNSQRFNLENGLTQEVERSRDQLDPDRARRLWYHRPRRDGATGQAPFSLACSAPGEGAHLTTPVTTTLTKHKGCTEPCPVTWQKHCVKPP